MMVRVRSTVMTLLLLFVMSARAANLGRHSLRRNQDAISKSHDQLLNHVGLVLGAADTSVEKSDITIREGLGENLPYNGIAYLGRGYDLGYGNPEGDDDGLLDPGYRAPVISLEWSQDARHNTGDMALLSPKQGFGVPLVACQHATTATTQSSMDDYSNSVEKSVKESKSVSLGGAFKGITAEVKFQSTRSNGMRAFRQDVASKERERFKMTSDCLQYHQQLERPANLQPTKSYFNRRVKKLPEWDGMVIHGDCQWNQCATLYMMSLKKYMVYDENKKKIMATTTRPAGRWLFKDHRVAWITSATGWTVDTEKTMFLTRHKKGGGYGEKLRLSMKPRAELETTRHVYGRQQWKYNNNYQLLTTADTFDKHSWELLKVIAITWIGEGNDICAIEGGGKELVWNYLEHKKQNPWDRFFEDFGTHFIYSVTLGGKLETTITMDSADVQKIKKSGMSAKDTVSLSASLGYGPFKAEGGYSKDSLTEKEKNSLKAFKQTKHETKTLVLGGNPPTNIDKNNQGGFGEWAATVSKKPMPVRIEVTSLLETLPFQCDILGSDKKGKPFTPTEKKRCKNLRATFSFAYEKYMAQSIRWWNRFDLEAAKNINNEYDDTIPDTWSGRTQVNCGSQIRSSNGRFNVRLECNGNLKLADRLGNVLYSTHTSQSCEYGKVSLAVGKAPYAGTFNLHCEQQGVIFDVFAGSYGQLKKTPEELGSGIGNAKALIAIKQRLDIKCNGKSIKLGSTNYNGKGLKLKIEDNGNLKLTAEDVNNVVCKDTGGDAKICENGGKGRLVLWQSGTGRGVKPLPRYTFSGSNHGFLSCRESQAAMEENIKKYR